MIDLVSDFINNTTVKDEFDNLLPKKMYNTHNLKQPLPDDILLQIIQMYIQGWTQIHIAKTLNISRSSVQRYVKKYKEIKK